MKTIFINDFKRYSDYVSDNKFNHDMKLNANKAKDYLRPYLPIFNPLRENFVIIEVEGYSCIAYLANTDNYLSVFNVVAPFSENRIYPLQEIFQKLHFVY